MARLSAADLAEAKDISREILSLDDSGRPVLSYISPRLAEFFESGMAGGYGVHRSPDGTFDKSYVHFGGPSCPPSREKQLAEVLIHVIRATPNRWGMFDPSTPEADQRNRADILDFPSIITGPASKERNVVDHIFSASRHFQANLHGCYQVRSLVCDGPSLLGWVGWAQPEKPTERQRLLLRSLIPALQHRLRVERQLGRVASSEAGFIVAMDSVPSAAFLCTRDGSIMHANAQGRVRETADSKELREELRAVIGGHPRGRATPLSSPGCERQFIVVLHAASDAFDLRLVRAATHWGLTRRQTEVLGHLARGETNRAIASILVCSDRTVEAHVTALLDKADVDSRARVMAVFWTLEA